MRPIDLWTASVASGREYLFRVYKRDAPFKAEPALYLLGYHHPKGHVGGNTVDPIYLGMTDDLAARLQDHPHPDCLRYEMFNAVCVVQDVAPEERMDCLRDLAEALFLPCGGDGVEKG